MAQLAEWLLPTPEVHSLNPGIGDFYIERLVTVNCSEKEAIFKWYNIPRVSKWYKESI